MASSSYAQSDLYHLTRGLAYTGTDYALGFLVPFGKAKTVVSAGRATLKAEKIVHASPTLLKKNAVYNGPQKLDHTLYLLTLLYARFFCRSSVDSIIKPS